MIEKGKVPTLVTLQVYFPSLHFVHLIQGKENALRYMDLLLDLNPVSELVFHNACFDYEVLGGRANKKLFNSLLAKRTFTRVLDGQETPIKTLRWTDVGIRWRLKLTEEGKFNGPVKWALDHVCEQLLGIVLPKDDVDANGVKIRESFLPGMELTLKHIQYACTDPVATVMCRDHMMYPYPTEEIQLRASIVLNDISLRGMYVDKVEFEKLTKKYMGILEKNSKTLAVFGYVPKVKHNKSRLIKILENIEERCGIVFPRSEKTNVISASSKVIEQFPDKVHPFLTAMKDGMNAGKILKTYLNRELIGSDGRVHTYFNVLVRTGRTSSLAPNVQNLPRGGGIRGQYRAAPGYVLVATDYCQQELIALAENNWVKYKQSVMRTMINDGVDLHVFFGEQIKEHSKSHKSVDWRQLAKACNFGFPGGLGPRTFIEYAKTAYGVDITIEEAAELKELWLKTFPEMQLHLKPPQDPHHKGQYVGHIVSGRVKPNCIYNAACNIPFQGLGADGSKNALWELYKLGTPSTNFVHDEVIAELPIDEHLSEACQSIADTMIKGLSKVCQHVTVRVEQAMMVHWHKKAKPIYSMDGSQLLCWTPDIVAIDKKDTKETWRSLLPYSCKDILAMDPGDIIAKVPATHRPVWNHGGKGLFGLQPMGSVVV